MEVIMMVMGAIMIGDYDGGDDHGNGGDNDG